MIKFSSLRSLVGKKEKILSSLFLFLKSENTDQTQRRLILLIFDSLFYKVNCLSSFIIFNLSFLFWLGQFCEVFLYVGRYITAFGD